MGRIRRHWKLLSAAALGLLMLVVGLVGVDVYPPATIAWHPEAVSGVEALRAPGLVLQDRHGTDVYATRGYAIYRSRNDGPFRRVAVVLPRFGLDWAGFSATLRRWTRHEELSEVVAVNDHDLIVFAGGDIYRVDPATGAQHWLHRLRYFGLGEGRGVMPHGITEDDRGNLYYGEYPTGLGGAVENVRIYRSRDGGSTWQVAYEFPPGTIRHIHAVEWDPYGRALWVATGDSNSQSRIGYSTDGGTTFTWIGSGSQEYRAVSLLFGPKEVSWVMDSPSVPAHLVRWIRSSRRTEESPKVLPSPGYYSYRLGPQRGLFTLAERDASVWLASANGPPQRILRWRVTPDPSRPNPSVRLMRSISTPSPDWAWVNPMGTDSDAAAIYRIRIPALAAGIEVAQARRP